MAKKDMSDLTVIYYTNNICPDDIFKKCQEHLLQSINGLPLVIVSQKPFEFGNYGKSIVMDLPSCWLSLYKQVYAGCEAAETKYVGMAEHDCMYHPSHWKFTPPTDDVFYYNENCWFVQWHGNHPEFEGMYSFWKGRLALSQLICNRDLMLRSLEARLKLLEDYGDEVKKVYQGEPGLSKIRLAQEAARKGKLVSLAPYLTEYLETEKAESFRTEICNLDIRHQTNTTGQRRGKNRTYELPYWGKFSGLMEDYGKTSLSN